jgi:CBS domain-containing protein
MTADVVTIPADATLNDVAAMLLDRGISGAPVVSSRGRVLGVVSKSDLVRTLTGGQRHGRAASRTRASRRRQTARDVMSSPAVTVTPERNVAHAATVMTRRGINRLPVLDRNTLVGIVSRADLVRAFARHDALIEQDIWSDVILRGVYVNPRRLDVRVQDGRVTVTGDVDTRGKARRLVEYIDRVPGVVSVHSEVTWHSNDGPPKGVPPAHRL